MNDVYVVASGLPVRNGDRHVVEMANCALDLLSAVISFKVPHRPKEKMAIRIGRLRRIYLFISMHTVNKNYWTYKYIN